MVFVHSDLRKKSSQVHQKQFRMLIVKISKFLKCVYIFCKHSRSCVYFAFYRKIIITGTFTFLKESSICEYTLFTCIFLVLKVIVARSKMEKRCKEACRFTAIYVHKNSTLKLWIFALVLRVYIMYKSSTHNKH